MDSIPAVSPGLLAFLRALAAQPSWRLNALPPAVDLRVLRILDDHGWVQARFWARIDAGTMDPSNPKTQLSPVGGWHSPNREPQAIGTWEQLFGREISDWSPPAEVQLSPSGHAAVDRLDLGLADSTGFESGPGAVQGSPRQTESALEPFPWLAELTPGQRDLWDVLAAKCGNAATLSRIAPLDTSAQTIRGWVSDIRQAAGDPRVIAHRKGYGYYRPDREPDWSVVKSKRQRRMRRP